MSELVESAVNNMLAGFGVRVTPERLEAYVDAVTDAEVCERCVVRACRNLTRAFKKVPYAAHLVDEAHEEMATAEHALHVAERRQLAAGDLDAWWHTEAPVLVRRAWPELSGEQAIAVALVMEGLGYVGPDWENISSDLGYVDERGPTVEREWWLRNMPELTVQPEDARYV